MENVERRLELIKMMRCEHKDNINRIQRREHILYPDRKISYTDRNTYDTNNVNSYTFHEHYQEKDVIDPVSRNGNLGFYLRLGISVGLFLIFFYMDRNNVSYLGISCDMVENMISNTFDLKSFAFMK